MSTRGRSKQDLLLEIADLRLRMAEAQDILRAIRDYEVDALLIRAPEGDQVYALETADQAYRQMVEQMREGAATLTLDGTVLFSNRQLATLLDTPADQLAGQSLAPCVAPDDWPRLLALLADPAGGRLAINLRGPAGARLPASVSASRIQVDERPMVLLLVSDLTYERQADRVARLLQLSRRLAVAVTGHQAAEAIVNGALQALDAYAGFVAVRGVEGLRVLHSVGYSAEQRANVAAMVSEPNQPVSDALGTRAVISIETLEERQQRYPHWPAPTAERVAGALLAAPLLLPDGVVGALHVCFAEPRAFEPDDREYALAVAQQCAQALERASLYSDMEERVQVRTAELQTANEQLAAANDRLINQVAERRAMQRQLENAREEERGRLAREMHDELGSTLTALKMELSRVVRTPSLPAETAPMFADLQALLNTAIVSVRRLATELRPHLLDDLGLLAALEAHFEEVMKRSGLTGQFRCQVPELHITGEAATACYRIVQEALTNVIRHAEATQAIVSVEPDGDGILVCVTDNGRGMDLEAAVAQGHFGLVGMRERASLLLAPLEIRSAPGQGTTVLVRLPRDSASAP